MYKKPLSLIIMIIGLTFIPVIATAAAPFYESKAIRIIVGFSAGGGYDTYARVLSRHMGKYIPGNPAIIVENMTGAGSLIAANYLYKIAKPDGLTIGHFNGGLIFNQVMSQPGVEFDGRKFIYLGAATTEESVCALTKASGITSIEKWMASKKPVKLGTTAPGAFGTDNVVKIIEAVLGLPTKIISGYKGTADLRLAAESGEIDGTAWGWSSMKVTWRKALETGDVIALLQAVPKPLPDLPKVPLAISLAKTEEARQLIEVGMHSPSIMTRPLTLPPGTPKERVQILVKALQETLKDKEFLAETEKAKLDLNPVTGEELEKVVAGFLKTDSAMVAKMKEILLK
jgi:tripartite-type tricarboxylate transporter receptor subunit TctC